MKSLQPTLIAFLAIAFSAAMLPQENAAAAPQIFRPKGKLIQRLRDDLNDGRPFIPPVFGSEAGADDKTKQKTPAKKPTLAKRPTAASANQPTPTAARKPGDFRPTRMTPAAESNSNGNANSRANQTARLPRGADLPREPSVVKTKGFGMVVRKAGEAFVVADVVAGGNAAVEGVKRGDRILEIGGAELLSLTEFEAIADSMRGGDRVEFTLERRGKKTKSMVQFGTPAPLADDADVAPARLPQIETPTPAATRRRLQDNYVPPTGSGGLRSILESGTQPVPTPRTRVESMENFDFPALNGPG